MLLGMEARLDNREKLVSSRSGEVTTFQRGHQQTSRRGLRGRQGRDRQGSSREQRAGEGPLKDKNGSILPGVKLDSKSQPFLSGPASWN